MRRIATYIGTAAWTCDGWHVGDTEAVVRGVLFLHRVSEYHCGPWENYAKRLYPAIFHGSAHASRVFGRCCRPTHAQQHMLVTALGSSHSMSFVRYTAPRRRSEAFSKTHPGPGQGQSRNSHRRTNRLVLRHWHVKVGSTKDHRRIDSWLGGLVAAHGPHHWCPATSNVV